MKRWRVILFLLQLASVFAQAPDMLDNIVFSSEIYSALGDHTTTVSVKYLYSGSQYLEIIKDRVRTGLIPGGSVNGNYTYKKTNTKNSIIKFGEASYNMEFLSEKEGQITDTRSVLYGEGKFRIRDAQISAGGVNLSTRTIISDKEPSVIGFVGVASGKRYVLVRAVGAGLKSFGVANTASKLEISAFDSNNTVNLGSAWDNSPELVDRFANLFRYCGAFSITPGQGDACILMEVNPGPVTVDIRAGVAGAALLEIYFLP